MERQVIIAVASSLVLFAFAIVGVDFFFPGKKSALRPSKQDSLYTRLLNLLEYKQWKKKVIGQATEVPGISKVMMPLLQETCDAQDIKLVILSDKMEFEWGSTGTMVRGTAAVEKELDYYIPLITFEWSLYTAEVFKRCFIKNLVIGHEFFYDTQDRAAIPDMINFQMLYGTKHFDPMYPTTVVHHELFHFFDWIMLGLDYSVDPEWKKLNNLPGFEYGKGGGEYYEEIKKTGIKRLGEDATGFLNYYSTTGVEEDKAEIYKSLVLFPEQMLNHVDPVIKKKAETIKARLEAFEPKCFNESFWQNCKERSKERTWVKCDTVPNSSRYFFFEYTS